MKDTENSREYEPTIGDVMGVVKDLAVSVEDLTEAVQTGFIKVENQFDRHERILMTLQQGQELLNERVGDVELRLGNTQNRIEDVVDLLEGNYEPRLKHLEKACV